jgi:hypothetical protein
VLGVYTTVSAIGVARWEMNKVRVYGEIEGVAYSYGPSTEDCKERVLLLEAFESIAKMRRELMLAVRDVG